MSKAARSARGLFRATGKNARPVKQRDLDGEIIVVDEVPREDDDFYPTPPEPTQAILTAEITFVAEQVYVLLPINTVKG